GPPGDFLWVPGVVRIPIRSAAPSARRRAFRGEARRADGRELPRGWPLSLERWNLYLPGRCLLRTGRGLRSGARGRARGTPEGGGEGSIVLVRGGSRGLGDAAADIARLRADGEGPGRLDRSPRRGMGRPRQLEGRREDPSPRRARERRAGPGGD